MLDSMNQLQQETPLLIDKLESEPVNFPLIFSVKKEAARELDHQVQPNPSTSPKLPSLAKEILV